MDAHKMKIIRDSWRDALGIPGPVIHAGCKAFAHTIVKADRVTITYRYRSTRAAMTPVEFVVPASTLTRGD